MVTATVLAEMAKTVMAMVLAKATETVKTMVTATVLAEIAKTVMAMVLAKATEMAVIT